MKKIIAMLVLAAALVCGPVAVSGQTVRDAMGTNKGRIERSGTVRDSQGRCLGKLSASNRRSAALLFFFDFFDL